MNKKIKINKNLSLSNSLSLVHQVIELQTLCPVRQSDCEGFVAIIQRSFFPGKQTSVKVLSILRRRRICFKEIVLNKTRFNIVCYFYVSL